jgi:2,4-didehydro-3-deoxy-L-rhamnonate hydrolase
MRLANVGGRAALVVDGRVAVLDLDPMDALARVDELEVVEVPAGAPRLEEVELGPPVPRPSKILAAALNYRSHAEESGKELPDEPVLFAKLPSALAGPTADIAIPAGRKRVDWEAELVVAIGRRGRNVSMEDAWSYVAGLMCGQDVSDREEQFRSVRQFTMSKSFDTYAPTGPVLVTPDELRSRDDLAVHCRLDGEEVQSGRTNDLIFSVPELVAWASRICTLEPGDLFFTGTPAGVGDSREPPRYLRPGNVVETEIEGIGVMRNRCVEA